MGLSGVLQARRMKVFLISVLYLSAVAALPHQDRQSGCVVPFWKGDGYCDDFNNFASCDFDGGDCCGTNVNKAFCNECKCKQGTTTAATTTTAAATTAAGATTTAATGGGSGCAKIPSWMKTKMSAVSGFDRIINGFKAPSPIPWQAHLREVDGSGYSYFCGGTILDSTTVLTAAHCYYSQNLTNISKYFIAAGATHVQDSSAQTAFVKSITLHENYNQNNGPSNDVAIIKLKTALTINAKVRPACLPAATYSPSGVAVASGWGLVGQKPNKETLNLMYVAKPVITKANCIKNFKWTASDITNVMVCAGDANGGESTCNGDSGGPLVVAGANDVATVIGATSFGPGGSMGGCGTKGYPAVYAYTVPFLNWIQPKMG